MFHGSTSPRADKQRAMGVLTEGTDLRDATVPGVTDKQRAMGVLTEGTNCLGFRREGQDNRSHDC
jgi:hypothetical protein